MEPLFTQPATELMRRRYSCRRYRPEPLDRAVQSRLEAFLASGQAGPFGAPCRLRLVAAREQSGRELRSLGTYGFIHDPAGFIVGAVGQGQRNLEDAGYVLERAVLYATDLGLGTCWLGGTFTRSSFARAIELRRSETLPAVIALGYDAQAGGLDPWRWIARGHSRHMWETLFFHRRFGEPLTPEAAGPYATPLEMVRLAPSASSRQPWRIVRREDGWHFYMRRTPGYRDNPVTLLMRIADLQRVDLGIALCHWELACREAGLPGEWRLADPGLDPPDGWTFYTASWIG